MLKKYSVKNAVKNAEFCVGLFMLLFAGILLWQIFTIEIPDSRIFPILILVIVTISAIMQFVSAFKQPNTKELKDVAFKIKEVIMLFVLFTTYPLYQILGFYTTLFLVVLSVSLISIYPFTKKKVRFAVLYSLVIIIICYICFYLILGLITPVGVLI